MKKRVLIIAYYFPPLGGGGVYRTLKFARYLPLFGWEPIILSVSNPDCPVWDYSLLNEIPSEVQVFRVPSFEFSRWEKRFFPIFRKGRSVKIEYKPQMNSAEKSQHYKLRPLLKGIYIFLTSWLRIPDEKVGWIPFALFEAISLIKSKKIDLIFVTSPPHSSHLTGLLLSKLTGKPWVADFRDDWLENDKLTGSFSNFRLKLERYLAKKVFASASFIIANSEHQKQTYQMNYPQVRKIVAIYNGYDCQDFEDERQKEEKWQDNKLHICHCGYFYPEIGLPFFGILKDFFLENPNLKEKIQVDLVGYLEKEYEDWIIQNQLAGTVKSWGFVEHQVAISFLLRSHLLIYVIGSDATFWKGEIAGKLFEYFASRNPILAFAPLNGESDKLIEKANSGWVFDPEDRQGIKSKLKEIYQLFLQGELRIEQNKLFIEEFERKNLTRKLSSVFENCLSQE